ncbi:MAG: hypothetical protein JWN07_1594 [Hyphomicrobiales bacterium]|nr:hypothetical protein [Hyphomicrobiales bacterium]
MIDVEFPSFPPAVEDARALLARLYREIGVTAVAAALDLSDVAEPAAARAALDTLHEKIQILQTRVA